MTSVPAAGGSLAPLLSSAPLTRWLILLALVLFATANIPWHLDEYDQAKQAYVAYEIAHGGDPLYQHTPRGSTATKPPLAGWISLGVFHLTGSWDIAWRLPGFVCALVLLALLLREGQRLLPDGGVLLAVAAFSFNLLTPRIATLVRTDMMLTLWIFLCGWLIYRKIRDRSAWTTGERWAFAAAMLAALLTKGPIIYAFLLPGMAAFLLLAPRDVRGFVWSGWWTWVLPLGIFVAWGVNGLVTNHEFYEDVVVREFSSRFNQALKSDERQQPIWFYFPHVLHKFLPWSLFLIALPALSANVRRALRERPEILWLAAWGLGGLLCMTFIPSKRVDRIYPIIPPLCLLVVAFVAACRCGGRIRAWVAAAVIFSVLFSGGYFAGLVWLETRDGADRLVRLGALAREAAGDRPLLVIDGRDEGMAMYAGAKGFTETGPARRAWEDGSALALLVPERELADFPELPPPTLQAPGKREAAYFLFLRPAKE